MAISFAVKGVKDLSGEGDLLMALRKADLFSADFGQLAFNVGPPWLHNCDEVSTIKGPQAVVQNYLSNLSLMYAVWVFVISFSMAVRILLLYNLVISLSSVRNCYRSPEIKRYICTNGTDH